MSRSRNRLRADALRDVSATESGASGQSGTLRRTDRLSPGRRWAFRLFAAVLIPALLFGILECLLRWQGTGYPASFLLPSQTRPGYLVDNYRFAWRFFPRALARSSQPILVSRQKPTGRKRIVVLGSSAAMGDPEPAFGLPRVLEALLELRFPDQEFEVINAAMTAVNSHVVLPIARDCRALDADAWVIYMGNNEVVGPYGAGTVFGQRGIPLWLIRCGLTLERTKIGQLLAELRPQAAATAPKSWGGMEMFLEQRVRHDDPALQRVYAQFARNLADILDLAIARCTPVVISTVVSNLKDFAPFASLHAASLTGEQLGQWQATYQRGCDAQANGQYGDAAGAFEQASQLDPDYAELQFRWAECLLALGDDTAAREKFQQARDLDTLRFRASSRINEIITSQARQRQGQAVHFLDACDLFARLSAHGIPGEEFLCEHVHFYFAGNYVLAKHIAAQLIEPLDLPVAGSPEDGWPTEQQCADRLGWTPYHQLRFTQELKTRLQAPPFDQQLGHEARDEKLDAEIARLTDVLTPEATRAAFQRYQDLLAQHPHDWALRKQFGALLEYMGDVNAATQQWVEVTNLLPHHAEAFYMAGSLMNRANRWAEAERSLTQALALRPAYARALNSLGITYSHQDRWDESYAMFARAIELQPDFAEAYMNWGRVLATRDEAAGALQKYQAAEHSDPDYIPAHVELGSYYVGKQQYDAAEPHYRAVVRLKPKDTAAHTNLGLLCLKQQRPAEAAAEFEQAIALDPANRLAQQALIEARRLAEP